MMKCDMCYDRTSVGKKPMWLPVLRSQARYFGTLMEIENWVNGRIHGLSTPALGPRLITEGEHVGAEAGSNHPPRRRCCASHEASRVQRDWVRDDLLLAGHRGGTHGCLEPPTSSR